MSRALTPGRTGSVCRTIMDVMAKIGRGQVNINHSTHHDRPPAAVRPVFDQSHHPARHTHSNRRRTRAPEVASHETDSAATKSPRKSLVCCQTRRLPHPPHRRWPQQRRRRRSAQLHALHGEPNRSTATARASTSPPPPLRPSPARRATSGRLLLCGTSNSVVTVKVAAFAAAQPSPAPPATARATPRHHRCGHHSCVATTIAAIASAPRHERPPADARDVEQCCDGQSSSICSREAINSATAHQRRAVLSCVSQGSSPHSKRRPQRPCGLHTIAAKRQNRCFYRRCCHRHCLDPSCARRRPRGGG